MIKLQFRLLLFSSILSLKISGCGHNPVPKSNLTDLQFSNIALEVLHLRHWNGEQSDSLVFQVDTLFQRLNVTKEKIDYFITSQDSHSETWKPILKKMNESISTKDEEILSPKSNPATKKHREK